MCTIVESGKRGCGACSIVGVMPKSCSAWRVALRHCAITAKKATSASGSPGMAPWDGASGVGPPPNDDPGGADDLHEQLS
eukprot:8210032-Lingulodinium_polyedra.AAC.1